MSQHLQSQSTVLTGARQTMVTWSRLIKTREELPTLYKPSFEEHFGSDRPFPHVVLTPSLDRFPRKTTEKLVVDTDEAMYIFEQNRNEVDASCYLYRDVCAVEKGLVLLDSWLTIHGKTIQGEVSVSTLSFNTISMRHFAGLLRKLRPSPQIVSQAQFAAEKDKFDCLSTASFKMMNYGRESLLPGETVLQFVLQPEIRQPLWTVFGRTFYKTLSPAHLTILTDRELILIRNAERVRESNVDKYGGVWQYIPLHRIDSLTFSKSANGRWVLSIHHQPRQTVERLFEAYNQPEIESLCSQLRALISER